MAKKNTYTLIKYSDGYVLVHRDHEEMVLVHSKDICHHGIKGQRWGVRRWQYEDGSLTPEGKIHYGRYTEKKARKAQGYENISNNTYAMRPWKTISTGIRGAAAGALIAPLTGGAAVEGALLGGPLGAISGYLGSSVASFLAKKLSQRNERLANKSIEKEKQIAKNKELDNILNSKEYTDSKESREYLNSLRDEAVEILKKESPDVFKAILKQNNGKVEGLEDYHDVDKLMQGLDSREKERKYAEKFKDNRQKESATSTKEADSKSSSYTQLQNRHDELEQKIKTEKDPLQKRFLQQELTSITLKLNDELERTNKQKYD